MKILRKLIKAKLHHYGIAYEERDGKIFMHAPLGAGIRRQIAAEIEAYFLDGLMEEDDNGGIHGDGRKR